MRMRQAVFVCGVMAKTSRIFVGAYFGGSADEVDAALVKLAGSGEAMTVRQTHCVQHAVDDELREGLRSASTGRARRTVDLVRLGRGAGEALADACEAVMKAARVRAHRIAGIGVIGRTVGYARPGGAEKHAATLELAWPAIVARRVGAATVAGFAETDLAAGGLGGPLWAWPDWLMFRDERLSRVVVHLASVATITFVG